MNRSAARRVLCLAVAVLAIIPAAQAAAAPHVVVWSGSRLPGSTATGVELRADGTGRRVTGDEAGAVHITGSFAPTGAKLAAIRAAASKLLAAGPSVTHSATEDGGYVSVMLQDGAKQRAVVDSGADSAAVTALLKALNDALPADSRLLGAGSGGATTRGLRASPATAPCPPGSPPATDVVKDMPLSDAAAAGMVQLTPKGRIGGDSVAVDGTWKPIAAPTKITVHLEISRAADDGTEWAPLVKGKLDKDYAGYTVDGKPVTFNFDVVDRAPGAAPRPCYHEILMHISGDVRSYVDDLGPGPQGGEWTGTDARAWPHEVGHLIGIDDHYNDYFHVNKTGADVKLPQNGLDGAALQAALPKKIKLTDGKLISKPWKGYEKDLMGAGKGRLRKADLAKVVAGADIALHDGPGDVLLNKNTADQNLVTGAPFDLRIPKGGKAHVDGMVAYCIDLHRHVPGQSGSAGFDLIGPAGALGDEAGAALQRVLDVVAARQPAPLEATPGANAAIWRVSDDIDTSDPDAVAILQAAGVPVTVAEKAYAMPHYDNGNAANPQTQALTLGGGPLAPPPAPVEGVLPAANTPPSLSTLTVARRRLRAGGRRTRTVLTARVTVSGAPDTVSLALTRRRGKRTVTVARTRAQTVQPGEALLSVVARGLTRGRYRLVARDAGGRTLSAAITVTGAARH